MLIMIIVIITIIILITIILLLSLLLQLLLVPEEVTIIVPYCHSYKYYPYLLINIILIY